MFVVMITGYIKVTCYLYYDHRLYEGDLLFVFMITYYVKVTHNLFFMITDYMKVIHRPENEVVILHCPELSQALAKHISEYGHPFFKEGVHHLFKFNTWLRLKFMGW